MKIYSWNMLYRNPDQDRAFSFIKDLDFDVLCLQEVPEPFLERLKTLPHALAFSIDSDRLEAAGKTMHTYCVLLSRYTITKSGDVRFPPLHRVFRTRLFIWFMHPWGWQKISNRRSLFVDIDIAGSGRIRVFCLHLTLSHPERILREFTIATELRDRSIPTLMCGDLNILESAHVTILNWLLGGRFLDILAWRNTRRAFQKRFAVLGLQNPLRGKRTQAIARSQLDHILVPTTFRIKKAEVLPDRVGSDHNPVFVECEP